MKKNLKMWFEILLFTYLPTYTGNYLTSVSLHGGNSSGEGRVGFGAVYDPTKLHLLTKYLWSMDASHMVCRHLGFEGAFASVSGDMFNSSGIGKCLYRVAQKECNTYDQ